MVHCWQGRRDTLEYASQEYFDEIETCGHTCLLENGHDGPHEWTRDDEIMVTFVAPPAPEREGGEM